MATATLSIDLEARLARLEQDMSRATKLVERSAGQMERSFAAAGRQITSALGAISATVVVGAMTQIASATIKGIDALNDFADATGTTVENASALEDIARRTGSSVESVSGALIKFNAQIQEGLKPGSEAARVFELLGLNAKELADIDPAEALLKTAQALAQFEDDGNKARVVYQLFGKSVREVAPLLKDMAENGRLNATVTAQQAAEAEKFVKAVAQASKTIQDLARSALLPMVEQFNALNAAFNDAGNYVLGITDKMKPLTVFMQTLSVLGSNVAYVFRETGREIGAMAAQAAALARGDWAAVSEIRRLRLADSADARSNQDALDARLMRLNEVPLASYSNEGRRGGRPSVGRAADAAKAGAAAASEAERYLEALQRQVESSLELTAVEKVLFDLNNNRLTLSNGVTREQLLLAAQVVDSLKEEAKWQDAVNKSAREAADARNREYEDAIKAARANEEADRARLRGILDNTDTGKFRARQQDLDFLQRMRQAEKLTLQEYSEAVRERFGLSKELEKTKSFTDELGLSFTSAFEAAIAGGNGLRDVLKGLDRDIIAIFTRQFITKPLGDALGKVLGGGSGGGGGFLAGIGNWIGSLFAGGFADGGFIPPGKWGVTGERGPEPIFGGRAGVTVRPAGGMSVTNHFTIAGPVDRRTQQQIAAAAMRGVQMASQRGN